MKTLILFTALLLAALHGAPSVLPAMPPMKGTDFAKQFPSYPAGTVEKPLSCLSSFSALLPEVTWRQINHFYSFQVAGTFDTSGGSFSLSVESVDKDGKVLDSQVVLTSADIQGKSDWTPPPLAITKAQLDHRSNQALTARLVLAFDHWKGTFEIKSFRAVPFKLTAEQRQKYFSCSGKPGIVATQSWDIGYTPAGSTPDTISDTTLKLIRTAGVEKMRVQAFWGEMNSHLIQGGTMPAGQNPRFEAKKGEYGFEYVDGLIAEAAWYGIGIGYMTLHGTPRY